MSRTLDELYKASSIAEEASRNQMVNYWWDKLASTNSIPLIVEDSVVFLYRGQAKSVKWMGDFNGWGYDKYFVNEGKKVANTDIWMLKASFPKDARLDYKILVNDSEWVIDLANPFQQWSGVGGGSPNSELRMPLWKEDPIVMPLPNIEHGTMVRDILYNSKALNYQVSYSVYLPFGYPNLKNIPVVYVTDGYEYTHERLGNMITILDNLIATKKIVPVMAVFVDQRDPINRSNNRRMTELAMNEKYLNFFTNELIFEIESKYPVSKSKEDRAILGNSLGGLTAAYFSFAKPELFGKAGIQSPAFWFKPDIYTFCDNAEKPPVKIFMTTGKFFDKEEGARKMEFILAKNTCTYQYKEVNQSHSWGNFRDFIDDILIYFFPAQ
ncbi:MAG: hypothetical protein L0Y35_00790 [Flammeovirgaceae bacterium]|nr:hypothetical protein [Flammeovirgaceae bacterium]